MFEENQPSAFISARPALYINGQERPQLGENLLAMVVEETLDGVHRCELRLNNWGVVHGEPGYLYFDRQEIDFGSELAVVGMAGDEGVTIFEGRVRALEGHNTQGEPPRLVVIAEGRFFEMRVTRRTRIFEEITDADVIQQIAGEHGLQAQVDLEGPTHTLLAQVDQSDLAFMRQLARRLDRVVWLEGDTLYAVDRAALDGDKLPLRLGDNLRQVRIRADLAEQRTAVGVSGWDPIAGEVMEASADEAVLGAETQGGLAGSTLLQMVAGPRPERMVRQVMLSTEEARALARAEFLRRARRFVTGVGVADGLPRLQVGRRVQLVGVGELFDGAYDVVQTRHLFDLQNGYRTEFAVERPVLGPLKGRGAKRPGPGKISGEGKRPQRGLESDKQDQAR